MAIPPAASNSWTMCFAALPQTPGRRHQRQSGRCAYATCWQRCIGIMTWLLLPSSHVRVHSFCSTAPGL